MKKKMKADNTDLYIHHGKAMISPYHGTAKSAGGISTDIAVKGYLQVLKVIALKTIQNTQTF